MSGVRFADDQAIRVSFEICRRADTFGHEVTLEELGRQEGGGALVKKILVKRASSIRSASPATSPQDGRGVSAASDAAGAADGGGGGRRGVSSNSSSAGSAGSNASAIGASLTRDELQGIIDRAARDARARHATRADYAEHGGGSKGGAAFFGRR